MNGKDPRGQDRNRSQDRSEEADAARLASAIYAEAREGNPRNAFALAVAKLKARLGIPDDKRLPPSFYNVSCLWATTPTREFAFSLHLHWAKPKILAPFQC